MTFHFRDLDVLSVVEKAEIQLSLVNSLFLDVFYLFVIYLEYYSLTISCSIEELSVQELMFCKS